MFLYIYLFKIYLTVFVHISYFVTSNGRIGSDQWIGKRVEGSGFVLIIGAVSAFAWRDFEE